ncbi:MAG TPA: hypothetical protein DCY13_02470 [Verrucomicrobiales bacterium]|nr:hypothetical protein [Verrucomicrobiales bacterium]
MSPIRPLLFELCRGQRTAFAATGIAVVVMALVVQIASGRSTQEWLAPLAQVLMAGSLVALFAGFTCTETNRQLKLAAFPVRLFSLPASTATLVLVPMVAGSVSVAAVYLAWAAFVLRPLIHDQPLLEPSLILMTGLICHQAVMWCLAQYRLMRLFICGGIGGLLLWLLLLPESVLPRELTSGEGHLPQLKLGALLALTNLAVVWRTWLAIVRQRHQPTAGSAPRKADLPTARLVAGGASPFRSPLHAQFWLEWRRNGWILPGLAVFAALLLAHPVPLLIGLEPESALSFVMIGALVPVALAALVGKGLAVPDFWTRDLHLPSFVAIRPLSCGQWVLVRLGMAMLSALIGCLAIIAALIVATLLSGSLPALMSELVPEESVVAGWPKWILMAGYGLLLAMLTWRCLVVSLHTGLLGRRIPFVTATLGSVVAVFIVLPWWLIRNWHEFTPYNTSLHWQTMVWSIAALWFAKLLFAGWAWSEARRRELVSTAGLVGYVACWLLVVLGTYHFLANALPVDLWVRQVIGFASGLLVPLGRIGLAPVFFSFNRHRRISTQAPDLAERPSLLPWLRFYASRHGIVLAAVVLASLLAAGVKAGSVARVVPRMIAVEDQAFRVLVCGAGSPVIVLEGDMESALHDWALIQQSLSRFTTVVAYDRAGIGGSPASPRPPSLAQNARSLHGLLESLGIGESVVLVGAHIGAAYARAFATAFPDRVAGMVLLDPTDEEPSTEITERLKRDHPGLAEKIDEYLVGIDPLYRPYAVRQLELIEGELAEVAAGEVEEQRVERWDFLKSDKVYMKTYQYTRADVGSQLEYRRHDELLREDRLCRMPAVPVTVLTGTKLAQANMLEREGLQPLSLERKLARRSAFLAGITDAEHVKLAEVGDDLIGTGSRQVVAHVHAMLARVRETKR